MAIRSFLFLLSLSISLFAETYQVELYKNVWNLVGVNGYHISSTNAIPVAGWTQLKDTSDSDNNTTWDMLDESTPNSVTTPDIGEKIYSTLGIYIESESNPELSSVIINYDNKTKDSSKTFLSMYVSSEGYGRKADIKIIFQSDYEGDAFYLTFNGSTTQSYEGKFSSLYTREAPLFMSKYKADSSDSITSIIKAVDMNLEDNNLSNLDHLNINFDTLNYGDTGGRQRLLTDENISVYRWLNDEDGERWNTYHSGNQASINDFDSFTAGEAYWVKIDTARTNSVGFLLGTGDIDDSTYTTTVASRSEGWNLLSFNESYIRHIASGVFVNNSDYNGSGLLIRDSYKKSSIVVPNYLTGSDVNVSAYINNMVGVGDANGSYSWNLRSYPAIDKDGKSGIILISDENFEVNASSSSYSTMSLAGQELRTDGNSETFSGVTNSQTMYETRIDEFVLAVKPNEEIYENSLPGHQSSLQYNVPMRINADTDVDLSGASNYSDVLSTVGNQIGTGFLIDQNLSGNYNTLLIASSQKFYLRDGSIVKLFDFNDTLSSTDFVLSYGTGTANIVSDGSLQDTVDEINLVSGGTGISAFIINNAEKRIMLMSKDEKYINIKEKGEVEQFSVVELEEESNRTKYGTITDVYYGTELARAKIMELNSTKLNSNWDIESNTILSGNTLTGVPNKPVAARKDLAYTPTWSPDFPIDSPLVDLKDLNGSGSRINYIISGVTRDDATVYWRQADTTMDSNRWKLEEERFNLFKIHKDRGYWVYTDYSTAIEENPITISEPEFTNLIVRNYNNYFDGNSSSNATSKVTNNITALVSVDIDGTDFTTGAPGENSENVQFHVDGEVIPLIKNGTTLTYLGELMDNEFSAVKERVYPSLKSGLKIVVTDGKGNRKEKITTYDNVKPIAPEYSFEDNNSDSGQGYFGGLRFVFDSNITLRVYDGNLSDYYSNDSLLIKDAESVEVPNGYSYVVHHVNPLDGNYITYGTSSKPYYDLRIIGSYDNDIWSDMRRVYYAPVYKSAHIIESSESNTSSDANDTKPIAFSSDGQTAVQYTEGGSWTDSGVELSSYDGNYSDFNTTLSMSYEPVIGAKFNSTIATEVYFDDNTSATGYVGRIRFSSLYAGDVFYIYSDETNTTYYQTFPSANVVSTDPLELIPIDSNQSFYKPTL